MSALPTSTFTPKLAVKSIQRNLQPSRPTLVCVANSSSNSSNKDSVDRRNVLLQSVSLAALALTTSSAAAPRSAKAEANIIDGQGTTRVLPLSEEDSLTDTELQILEYNKRTQRQNNTPPDFPLFIREGYDMTVLVGDGWQTSPEGIIYKDFVQGTGDVFPQQGQQVTFDYTAYNESANVVDSSYRKGQPAQTQLGINGLVPGFELGLSTMKPGGKRRLIVPPELGPPVGPSTFFSAKQYEVFDVELRAIKTCTRRQVGMFSDIVCE